VGAKKAKKANKVKKNLTGLGIRDKVAVRWPTGPLSLKSRWTQPNVAVFHPGPRG
jgi:hypothetical protein